MYLILLIFTFEINTLKMSILRTFVQYHGIPLSWFYQPFFTIWVVTGTGLSSCVCHSSFIFLIAKAAVSPLTLLVTPPQFDFYLIFIIRLPFLSPGFSIPAIWPQSHHFLLLCLSFLICLIRLVRILRS